MPPRIAPQVRIRITCKPRQFICRGLQYEIGVSTPGKEFGHRQAS